MKLISKIRTRKIPIRDSNRCNIFENEQCSCNDNIACDCKK